ncbi:uncharacterized protein LOC112567626 [Pomacea canaliculata]|uniref:uncharacterized protein LOC112567626 n=1 Tax=Pomacea canaliculata TaxID=400727 RepID=UPI000D72ED1A|nr:uncharacterized protein LOC112567626 [Pomacea canaliculata]
MSRPDTYVNGTCKINSPLPPEGNYRYNIIITPGQTQVPLSFIESSEIRSPSQPPSHNCPLYVEENDDVKCSCYTTDLGKPSGLVMWRETGSSELRLEKVNRTQHEQTYTCSLMWNNTDVFQVTYTLQVNYSSRVLTFKINNMDIDTVNVSENKDMTVVCKADVRPTPSLSLFKNIDNQKFKLSGVKDSDELTHTMTAVTCQDAGNYVCESENIIGVDTKSIQVFVFCSPRRLTNESYLTTLDGDEASFEMIAYPDPDSLIIIPNGSSLNDTNTTKLETNFSAEYQCTRNTLLLYRTTCDVIFRSKTVYSAGLYIAIFSNVFGNVSFTFEVKEKMHPSTKPLDIDEY